MQLQVDEDKLYSWPLYVTALRALHRCPCSVLVVAPDVKVAEWAAGAIDIGQPESAFVPLVLGPGAVPEVTRVEMTRACPELGVLSALVHTDNEGVAWAALEGTKSLFRIDEELATLYNDVIMAALDERVRAGLEEKMGLLEGYEYQSEFARKHFGRGREKGLEEGRAEEAARAVLAVFEARDRAVPDDPRARVEACGDLDVLERWLKRAIKVESPVEIFEE